jgi:hypothetical protein
MYTNKIYIKYKKDMPKIIIRNSSDWNLKIENLDDNKIINIKNRTLDDKKPHEEVIKFCSDGVYYRIKFSDLIKEGNSELLNNGEGQFSLDNGHFFNIFNAGIQQVCVTQSRICFDKLDNKKDFTLTQSWVPSVYADRIFFSNPWHGSAPTFTVKLINSSKWNLKVLNATNDQHHEIEAAAKNRSSCDGKQPTITEFVFPDTRTQKDALAKIKFVNITKDKCLINGSAEFQLTPGLNEFEISGEHKLIFIKQKDNNSTNANLIESWAPNKLLFTVFP